MKKECICCRDGRAAEMIAKQLRLRPGGGNDCKMAEIIAGRRKNGGTSQVRRICGKIRIWNKSG